ncbi:hypothetical protein Tco_0284746, partial [Tanacetum coccineum]
LEYIDNDVWKVIQNGNSKKRISTGNDCVIRILPPISPAEIHAVEKERKARTILLMAIPKEHLRRFHGMNESCKRKEQLQKTLDSWKDSSKNLWRLINSGMSSSIPTVLALLPLLQPIYLKKKLLLVLLMKLFTPSLPNNKRIGTCFMKTWNKLMTWTLKRWT